MVATATPQRSVAGRVVDETGAAVSGALVSLHSPLYVDRSVASGSNGEFTFTNVPVGVWSISASKRGYVRSMYSATTASGLPTVFDVTSSRQVDDMVIRLRRGGAITGRVTGPYGRPQERARVLAFRVRSGPDDWLDDDEAVAAAVTDGFGRYRLTDVSDGLYLIRAAARLTPPGVEIRAVSDRDIELAERILAGTRTEISTRKTAGAGPDAIEVTLIPTFFPGTIDSRSAAVVTVMAGQTSEGIDIAFSLSRAASVHGVVIDDRAKPSPNAIVQVWTTNGSGLAVGSGRTDEAGLFVIAGVAPGPYRLVASALASGVPSSRRAATLWSVEPIVLTDSDLDRTLLLREGAQLGGTVRAPVDDGVARGIGGATVTLASVDGARAVAPGRSNGTVSVKTDMTGAFLIPDIVPGRYLLTASAPVPGRNDAFVMERATLDGVDVSDSAIDFGAEQSRSVDVLLAQRLSEIEGTVLGSDERPVARLALVLFSSDPVHWVKGSRRVQILQSSTDGHFRFSSVPAGRYHLAALFAVTERDVASSTLLSDLAQASIVLSIDAASTIRQDIRIGR